MLTGELHFSADVVLILAFLLQISTAKKKDDKPKKNIINIAGEDVEEDPLFASIRSLYGLSSNFVSGSKLDLEGAIRESGGAHAIIARSEDNRFIAKDMSDVDWESLHNNLRDYYRYLHANPATMLPRFFSAYKRETDGKYWVIMFNWLSGKGFAAKNQTRVYDLKGTTCSHKAGDRLVRMNFGDEKVPTLKDLNFVQQSIVIHTSPAKRMRLLEQLTADTEFLKGKNLMDYSIILRVMAVGQCDKVALKNTCPVKKDGLYETFFQEHNGYHVTVDEKSRTMNVYEFGLIDVLQPYNNKKSLADSYKSRICGDEEIRDTVDSNEYQRRFVEFFTNRIVGDARMLDLAECKASERFDAGKCTVIDLQPAPASSTSANFDESFRSFSLWLVVIVSVSWLITIWICRRQTLKLQKRLLEVSQTPQVASVALASLPPSDQIGQYGSAMSGVPPWGNAPMQHGPSSFPLQPAPSWGVQTPMPHMMPQQRY